MDTSAEIVVDAGSTVGEIHPHIYGHFIEHLGRCIYGGVWVGPESKLPNVDGLRRDVLNATKAIHPPVIRWPGGNFASGYHWEDGVAPRDRRPARFDLAWKAVEPNQFGTDEFIDFCRKTGAEPYICVNMGSGSAEEAARWVEYCNLSTRTHEAQRRASMGHPEPHGVKYWGLGNETYGDWQIGHMPADAYSKSCSEFAKLIRRVDPSVKLIAVGCDSPDWNRKVLSECWKQIDYISLHKYYRGGEDYYDVVAAPLDAQRCLGDLSRIVETTVPSQRQVHIAFDEWNLWYPEADERSGLHQRASLTDGIFACGIFNALHRLCRTVKMANLAQLVNVLPAIVTDDEGRIYVNPTYLAFKLYVDHTGTKAVRTEAFSDTYRCGKYGLDHVPYLDASASLGSRMLHLAVVNRSRGQDLDAVIRIRKAKARAGASVFELGGQRTDSFNSFEDPDAVTIGRRSLRQSGSTIELALRAHSAAIVDLPLG